MDLMNSLIEYACTMIIVIVVGYLGYQYFRYSKKDRAAKNVNGIYKTILDEKLLPMGFACEKTSDDGREKIFIYSRGTLRVTLYYEPAFYHNTIYTTSGKKITLQEHVDQLPAEIRNKARVAREGDKDKLVSSVDFKMDLSDSDDVRNNFIQSLNRWLLENQ